MLALDIKYIVTFGLIIGLLFIGTVASVSYIKGWDQPQVSTNDEILMTQCIEIAKRITPEGANVSTVAIILFKEVNRRF